ncbi:outer membrane protein assembly factor BamB family protein [Thalassoroseus pseudoceratinae]|uniref:outer membrane protein assembly factor BamB family protein n=1 Tax=Thalassoroseus pseudoceratinae TaxID=2713176 RepID=UPI0014226B40|nr:PQQ-binding-like beta-propeller repeat protein [Thalassoroseus pseudoceratinae]
MRFFRSSLLCSLCLVNSFAMAGESWPQFRGPDGNGHGDATNLPVEWSESENVSWKTAIPGDGHSSPVIADGRVWLTTAVAETLTEAEKKARLAKVKNSRGLELVGSLSLRAICVDAESGKILQNVEVFNIENPEPIHSLNSYASPTPVVEGERLFCHFGTYGTACLDSKTGEKVWEQRTLTVDHQNGPGASPIVWNDLLIAQYDGIDRQFVVALDKRTGKIVWKTPRSGKLNDRAEFQKAYATPHVVDVDGKPILVSPGADWVYGYDPASGEEIWRISYGGLGFSTVPRPVIGHGMAYIVTSFMQSKLLAVRYDGKGDVSESHVVWTSGRQVPKKPSLLLIGDELYLLSDAGIFTCVDAKTGAEHYRQRLGGQYSASPLFADGNIYLWSQEGIATVVKPGTEYVELARNEMNAGFMASPAVVDDALFVRTETHLFRIEK